MRPREWAPPLLCALAVVAGYVDLRFRLAEPPEDVPPAWRAPPAAPAPATSAAEDRGGAGGSDEAVSAEVVQATLARHGNEVFACRDEHAPDETGTLTLFLRVEDGGRVAGVALDGTSRDAAVRECVTSAARTWSFASADIRGCAVVSLPFLFRAPGSE